MAVYGLDISAHQRGFDFSADRARGHEFIGLKQTEGLTWPEDNPDSADLLRWYRAQARNAGYPLVLLYHFARPQPGRSGRAEAEHFINFVGDLRPGEAVTLDLEANNGLDAEALESFAIDFVDRIEAQWPALRHKVLLYSYAPFLAAMSTDRLVGRCPLWIAAYGRNDGTEYPNSVNLDRWPSWTIWQFTSNPLDRNRFDGTIAEMVDRLALPRDIPPPRPSPGGTVLPLHTLAAAHSSLALDAQGWGTELGTRVVHWAAHGGANQKWLIEDLGAGEFRIRNAHNGLVLDVAAWSLDDAAPVQLWEWHGGANQRWRISVNGGLGKITSVHSGKVLDVALDTGLLIQFGDHGGLNQRFFGTTADSADAAPLREAPAPATPPPPPPPPAPPAGPDIGAARTYIDNLRMRLGVTGIQEALHLVEDGNLGPVTADAVLALRDRGGMLRPNFSIEEFRCTHCGRCRVHWSLLDLLQSLRNELGPMGKDSSYRCEQHPIEAAKASGPGMHASGRAWDPSPDFAVATARRHGANGIGYARADRGRCTHIDKGNRNAEFQDNRAGGPEEFDGEGC